MAPRPQARSPKAVTSSGRTRPSPTIMMGTGSPECFFKAQGVEWSAVTARRCGASRRSAKGQVDLVDEVHLAQVVAVLPEGVGGLDVDEGEIVRPGQGGKGRPELGLDVGVGKPRGAGDLNHVHAGEGADALVEAAAGDGAGLEAVARRERLNLLIIAGSPP